MNLLKDCPTEPKQAGPDKCWHKKRPLIQKIIIYSFFIFILFYFFLLNTVFVYALINELHMNDFGKIYYSTQSLVNGGDIYQSNPATYLKVAKNKYKNFWNLNPPHLHIVFIPLALLSEKYAIILWMVICLFCLFLSIELIAKEINYKIQLTTLAKILCAILLFSGTSCISITGQMISFIYLLLFTLAWINARHNKWNLSAFYIGILISVKSFLLIFILYLLLRKKIKPMMIALLTAGAIFGLGILFLGVDIYSAWFHIHEKMDWAWASMNGSLLGILARNMSSSPYYSNIADLPNLIKPIWTFGFLSIGTITILSATFDHSSESIDRGFAIILIGSLLMSPLGWLYYLWLIMGPLTVLIYARRENFTSDKYFTNDISIPSFVMFLFIIWGYFIPFSFVTLFQPHPLASLTVGSLYFWMFISLWFLLLKDYLDNSIFKVRCQN